jgi:oxygen-independent coproporphyrinogen-3 oxidase
MEFQVWAMKMEAEYWKGAFFGVSHISSYALTVEPKTAMSKMIQTGKMEAPKTTWLKNILWFC